MMVDGKTVNQGRRLLFAQKKLKKKKKELSKIFDF